MAPYDGDASSSSDDSEDSYGDTCDDHVDEVCIPPCESEDIHGLKSLHAEEVSLARSMESENKSICMEPLVAMDVKAGDVHSDDVVMVVDTAMDIPIVGGWDLESLQDEEPQVDMDISMASNVTKAIAMLQVMRQERECSMERESSMDNVVMDTLDFPI